MERVETQYFGQPPVNKAELPHRSRWQAFTRGFRGRCPNCGKGHIFHKYLKVSDRCPACGEELLHQRADDAPAYFTIAIVGHVVVAGALILEENYAPPLWFQDVLWLSLVPILTLTLLPRIKGALIAMQWALRMHGFGGVPEGPEAV